jgi:2-polyprenyl-3-methyl-5-hydroxy-6-metoxy-1,4-benzoquinol methylase
MKVNRTMSAATLPMFFMVLSMFSTYGMASSNPETTTIKTMKLYSNIDRIEKELENMGYSESSALSQEILSKFDSMHYDGDKAIQAALDVANHSTVRRSDHNILDVGSGFGGPARYMASRGNDVLALELQKDVHEKGVELTQRCDLSSKVTHVCGDILETGNEDWRMPEQYDLLTSWLVFLHISDKKCLLGKCASCVKKGGSIFIEDFYKREEFSPEEEKILSRDIYCESETLLTREEYIASLEEAGFTGITFVDKTDAWTSFVSDRFKAFLAAKDRFVSIHGIEAYTNLHHFYHAMYTLFGGSSLGGVRIYGTKK